MNTPKEIHRIFLIADLSGYTALTEAHGNISAAKVVSRYVEMVQEVLDKDAHLAEKVGDEVLIVGTNAVSIIQMGLNLRDKIETNVTDPVCRMLVKPDTAPAHLSYNHQNYFFCSFECAKIFASRPDLYIKK